MVDAWGGAWSVSFGVSWGAGVTPPTPEWQPAQGSQGGSTMRLARPAGRFGDDHALYPGSNVPDAIRPITGEPELPIADISTEVVEYASLTDRIASLERAEAFEMERSARIDRRIADMAARAEIERLELEAEEEENAMLLIAIGVCI